MYLDLNLLIFLKDVFFGIDKFIGNFMFFIVLRVLNLNFIISGLVFLFELVVKERLFKKYFKNSCLLIGNNLSLLNFL